MRFKMVAFAVAAVLSIGVVAGSPAQAATPKAGAACAKAGITQVVKAGTKSTKFTCLKSGKKTVWNKGVVTIAKPAPTPTAEPTQSASPTPTPTPSPTLPFDPTKPKVSQPCDPKQKPVIGYDEKNFLVYLVCNGMDSKLWVQPDGEAVDQSTGKEYVGPDALYSTRLRDNFGLYVYRNGDLGAPKGVITDSSTLSNVDLCRVSHGEPAIPNFSSGFPIKPERMSLLNSPTVQFIAIDFEGLRAKTKPRDDFKDVVDTIQTFYQAQATRPINIEFRIPDDYADMPKRVEDYGLDVDFFAGEFTGQKTENYWSYVRTAIKLVDKDIDFTGVETLVIATPPGVKDTQIGAFVAEASSSAFGYVTDEGVIRNVLIRGDDEVRDLDNWTHEFSHMLGLNDLRNTLNKGDQKSDGLGYFDLMANPNLPELLVWNRFILGILFDDQIRCVTNQASTTHWLSPVAAKTTKPKGVVIPLSSTTAIIIESRRHMGFDVNMGLNTEGALVYKLDTKVKYGLSPMKIVYPKRSIDRTNETDSTLRLGESVTTDGWKITVTENGLYGDVVKVEKVG